MDKETKRWNKAIKFVNKAETLEKRIVCLKNLLRSRTIRITLWPDKGGMLPNSEKVFTQKFLKEMIKADLIKTEKRFSPIKKEWEELKIRVKQEIQKEKEEDERKKHKTRN